MKLLDALVLLLSAPATVSGQNIRGREAKASSVVSSSPSADPLRLHNLRQLVPCNEIEERRKCRDEVGRCIWDKDDDGNKSCIDDPSTPSTSTPAPSRSPTPAPTVVSPTSPTCGGKMLNVKIYFGDISSEASLDLVNECTGGTVISTTTAIDANDDLYDYEYCIDRARYTLSIKEFNTNQGHRRYVVNYDGENMADFNSVDASITFGKCQGDSLFF